jgi:hypothetical protein
MTRMKLGLKRIGKKMIVSDPLHPALFRVIRVPLTLTLQSLANDP